jgi:hypothetical protein
VRGEDGNILTYSAMVRQGRAAAGNNRNKKNNKNNESTREQWAADDGPA